MLVRTLKEGDLDALFHIITEFKEEALGDLGISFNVEMIKEMVQKYMGSSFVVIEDGIIVGILAGSVISLPGYTNKVYREEIWYVLNKFRRYGIYLLKHVEEWCVENGINRMIMAHMINDKSEKIGDFYIKSGFKPMEIHYMKDLEAICQ